MSAHGMEAAWKALWLIAASLFFIALIALTALSVEQGYIVVLKSLLTLSGPAKILWLGAAAAAIIPMGFLTFHGCRFIMMSGELVWRFIFR
jgi:hypothetical protein